jgi:ATP-dependent Clp protease adapter protein ClpS
MPAQVDIRAEIGQQERLSRPWVVILYNDDWHGQDEVTLQIQKATGYDLERAERVMYEAHTQGRAIVYEGTFEECEHVAAVLRQIRLQVETDAS